MNSNTNRFQLANNEANIEINQYLSLEHLFCHLLTKTYYIGKKALFNDAKECEIPLKYLFMPTQANCRVDENNKKLINNHLAKCRLYKLLSNNYISCWTKEKNENYLMWKAYTPKFGVRISSTVSNFTASFDPDYIKNYDIYGSSVSYEQQYFTDDTRKLMFSKDKAYKDEREYRFLFIKPQNSEDHIKVPYNPKIMIDKITLSPFIPQDIGNFIRDVLDKHFNLNAYPSKIINK